MKITEKAFLNCDYAQKFFGAVYKCCVVGSAVKEHENINN